MMRVKFEGPIMQYQLNRPHCLWDISFIHLAVFVCSLLTNVDLTESFRRGNLLIPRTYSPISGDLNVQLQYFSQEKQKTVKSNFNRDDDSASLSSEEDDFVKTTSAPKQMKPFGDDDVRLQVSRFVGTNRTTVAILDVYPDQRSNITQITISCMNFLFGGTYELEIVGGNDIDEGANTLDNHDERLRKQLDVRWPQPKLSVTPESIGTYPQQPVDVILEFPGIECIVPHTQLDTLPEFWLELYYCGHEVYCDSANVSSSQVLYAEQIRGYPKARLLKLSCELFGLAGHYVVKLRPTAPVAASVSATAYIQADWSEQFVFNVHARSISPCDPHSGIGVLFEYPACILDRADRIRLFGKLRADVASLAPPTSLHYITEQRVVRGQHALHFDCDFFSEKYVEYCFVYVSQAISGAVADVRMDCLPTLPVRESERGGWGPWSEYTPCSTTCAGGTRSRYRVCDSPPPRYGAMFCEGNAVETEECGGSISDSWENCIYGAPGGILPSDFADRPGIKADLGSDCRCGCIVHLTVSKPRRIISASAQSCPGRTFWLLQAEPGYRIRFHFDFFRLICSDQYVRVRDGDSLLSELVGEFFGGTQKNTDVILSSGSKLLLEFYSNELSTIGESCKGGFLTHAQQFQTSHLNITEPRTSKAIMSKINIPSTSRITMVHVIAILFSSIIIVVSAMLGAQYVCRYRKYQLAESAGEPDSPVHTPRTSMGSIAAGQLPSRAVSTSTLLSEVVSFVKIRPRGRWMKHSRLRESVDGEALEVALQNGKAHSDDAASLDASTHTLTNETFNGSNDACETSDVITAPKRKKNNKQDSGMNGECSNEALSQQLSTSPSSFGCSSPGSNNGDIDSKEDDDKNDRKNLARYKRRNSNNINSISLPRTPLDTPMPRRRDFGKKRNTNTATPAAAAAAAATRRSTIAENKDRKNEQSDAKTTTDTNCNGNSRNKDSGSDDVPTETKRVNGEKGSRKKRNHLNMVGSSSRNKVFSEDSERDSDSRASINKHPLSASRKKSDMMRRLSVSNATLRNSCYSPASSVISVSTNRSVNIKESKEKKNREKLLAGPGSEFSLAPEDMEMDYYDYNVINAGAAPGSYLGMDPAYLVWIPPIDDGTEHTEDDDDDDDDDEHSDTNGHSNESEDASPSEEEPHYEEISPTYANSENRKEEAPELPPLNKKPISPNSNNGINEMHQNADLNKVLLASAFSAIRDDVDSPKGIRRKISGNLLGRKVPDVDAIPMTEFRSKKLNGSLRNAESPAKVHRPSYQNQEQRCSYASDDKDAGTEKETAVVKSPSDKFKDYYELDDIQFADDDSEDDCDVRFNRNQTDYATSKMHEPKNSHTLFEMH